MSNNVISVTVMKGGSGKSSLTLNVAALTADRGFRVLVVDADPQGNSSSELLGHHREGDGGAALVEALMFDRELKVMEEVRPGLDLVCGGASTEYLAYGPSSDSAHGINRLRRALAPLAPQYDLVFIDHPPLVRPLRLMGLAASRFAIVPTRPDDSSIAGVTGVARDFAEVRPHNPNLELLGVVLFGVGSSSKKLREEVRTKVSDGLGEIAPVFNSVIRYMESPATQARNAGMAVHEYARSLSESSKFTERKQGASAAKLAGDYLDLTLELLDEMRDRFAAENTGGKHADERRGA